MEFYHYALFLHIVGVLGMFIAIGLEQAALTRLRAAKTTVLVREWSRVMHAVEKMFPIAGTLIFGAGLYMVLTVWGWGQSWIDVSLGAFLLIGVLAHSINSPRFKAIRKAIASESDGPLAVEISQLTHDSVLRTNTFITDFLTLGIVCLMTTKPDWIGALAVMAVAFAVGLIVSRLPLGAARPAQLVAQPSSIEAVPEKELIHA